MGRTGLDATKIETTETLESVEQSLEIETRQLERGGRIDLPAGAAETDTAHVWFNGTTLVLDEGDVGYSGSSDTLHRYRLKIDGSDIVPDKTFRSTIPHGEYEGMRSKSRRSEVKITPDSLIEIEAIDHSGDWRPFMLLTVSEDQCNTFSSDCSPESLVDPADEIERILEKPVTTEITLECFAGTIQALNRGYQIVVAEAEDKNSDKLTRFRSVLDSVEEGISGVQQLTNMALTSTVTHSGLTALEEAVADLLVELRNGTTLLGTMLSSSELDSEGVELIDDAADELHSALREFQDAFDWVPKKFFPDSWDEIREGDVLNMKDGSRVMITFAGSISETVVRLDPDGNIETVKKFAFEALKNGDVEYVERGGSVGLHPGATSAVYTPYKDLNYLKPGDLIVAGGKMVEVLDYDPATQTLRSINYSNESARWHLSFREPTTRRVLQEVHHGIREFPIKDESECVVLERLPAEDLSPDEMIADAIARLEVRKRVKQSTTQIQERTAGHHPALGLVNDAIREIEAASAQYVQHLSDQILTIEDRELSQIYEEELNKVSLELLQLRKIRAGMSNAVSAVTDYLMIGEEAPSRESYEEPPDSRRVAIQSKSEFKYDTGRSIEYLQNLLDLLEEQAEERPEVDIDQLDADGNAALNVLSELRETVNRISRKVSRLVDKIDAKIGTEPEVISLTESLKPQQLSPSDLRSIKKLASQVPWASTAEAAAENGAHFHYDPEVITRMLKLPGIELITYKEQAAGSSKRELKGVMLYFPPQSIPKEVREQAGKQDGPALFAQLVIVDPEANPAAADMLCRALVIHSQRHDAEGYFGSVPQGHLRSFGAQFRAGAILNHSDQPTAERQDGSVIRKRGIFMQGDPGVRSMLSGRNASGKGRHSSRLKLLKEEAD